MKRKLAAIMVADVVGSTADMETDEDGTVQRIAACLDAVGEQVDSHEGRVFNTAGDAILAEFPSAVNALRAAMASRGALAQIPDTSSTRMRFGLHIADVLAVGDDLRGDGVNLAARIQSSAEPGQIDVSATLYDNVRRNSPCIFDELGEQTFKGVSEPIQIYRVRTTVDRHRFQNAPSKLPVAKQKRPNSLAIAPFKVSSSEDEDQAFLAAGLTDDLTLELSRLTSIFVSSRSAVEAFETNDPVEVGRVLGVQFVLSGSVRKLGNRIRLNISLSETDTGQVIWSDRIQRAFDDVLDIMDEITRRVAATVSGRVEQAALVAARLKRPENMSAYEFYLRGIDAHRLGGVTDKHVHQAVDWFEKAKQADPNFGRAYAMQVCSLSFLPDFDMDNGARLLTRALELDPTDPEAHRIMGVVRIKKDNDYEASRRHNERAMELAPNDAYIMGRCASFYTFAGEADKALSLLDEAEQLDPFLPVWVTEERIATLYTLDRFADAIAASDSLPFQTRRSRIYRAAAFVALGEPDRAKAQIVNAIADDPSLSTAYIHSQELFQDKSVLQTLIKRAGAAGLPRRRQLAPA